MCSAANMKKTDNTKQELFTIGELADKLNVSYQWADRRARKGMINFINLGRKRMVTIEEIERIKMEGVK